MLLLPLETIQSEVKRESRDLCKTKKRDQKVKRIKQRRAPK